MKSSLHKLHKFFKLEAERGYDDRSVMGGFERMLEPWEMEARADGLPNELIVVVTTRLRDYRRLSSSSRQEVLFGLWQRIQERLGNEVEPLPELKEKLTDTPESTVQISPAEQVADTLQHKPKSQPEPKKPQAAPTDSTLETKPAALNASITVLTGVGSRHGQTLKRLGLKTLGDMLYYFPRRYDDYTRLKPINRLWYGEEVTVIGTLDTVVNRPIRGGNASLTEAVLSDGSGALRLTWFNQPWIGKRLRSGMQVVVSGKIDQYLGRLVMNNPEVEPLEQQNLNTNRIVPVYSLTANITQRWLRRLLHQVVTYWSPRVADPLPMSLRRAAQLMDLPTALMQIHFPDSWEQLEAARYRLAFEEIFYLQMGLLRQKLSWQERSARAFETPTSWLQNQISRLPFQLTEAQERCLADLRTDLASGRPMNRLIQGDVGSGKTIVAALGIAMVVRHGSQAALMAPTSILAEQHYQNLLQLLASPVLDNPEKMEVPVEVRTDRFDEKVESEGGKAAEAPLRPEQIRLLVGSTPEREKNAIREGLANGEIKLVIGTHALIEEPVTFADLQLAIIDEQHRFGVEQRASLRNKGQNPHLLVMTATPIPRSLALSIYGDLDLSIIDELPPGRKDVETHVLTPLMRERAYTLVRRELQSGRQAFIIYPLVEEGERFNTNGKAAVEEHERLQREIFPEFRLGLLHGRVKPDEKEEVMARFRDGEYHILVSTTVVEVGVDIPNATVMLVEGANRFGLAQLHQLRGRVGRGHDKSYCLLIPETEDTLENERLMAMVETNDGFVLAERDLEQRGPGDFLGTRQSGYPELRMAKLTDVSLIEKARVAAKTIIEHDPNLEFPEHQPLAEAISSFWKTAGDIS